jgi:hypothetical protein
MRMLVERRTRSSGFAIRVRDIVEKVKAHTNYLPPIFNTPHEPNSVVEIGTDFVVWRDTERYDHKANIDNILVMEDDELSEWTPADFHSAFQVIA